MRLTNSLSIILLFWVGLLTLPIAICHADEQQHDIDKDSIAKTINKIEALLKEWYVLPDSAKMMIELLQENHRAGKYDGIKSPRVLADALTRDIRKIVPDNHLVVKYDPDTVEEIRASKNHDQKDNQTSSMGAAEWEEQYYQMFGLRNFGFKRVEILPGNIGYLDFRYFAHTRKAGLTAVSAINFMSFTRAIILDLRHNRGGDNAVYQLVASYFIGCDDEVMVSRMDKPIGTPWEMFWSLPHVPGRELCDVDLYILTGPETFSQAEGFAGLMQALDRATIIGDSTQGGGVGSTKYLEVNDLFYIGIPYTRSVNPVTGEPSKGECINPDIQCNSDDALNEALKVAMSKLVESLSGNEVGVNRLGYEFLREGFTEVAIDIFRRNTEFHPESSNAFDSYAEGCLEAGKRDLAIKNYRKSLELDPDNTNAQEMLKKLVE